MTLLDALKILVVLGVLLNVVPVLVYAERRVSALIQDRLGPNRVGPAGLFQPLADAVKFIFKEDIIPGHVDRVLYVLAPVLAFLPPALAFAVIPFGHPVLLFGEKVDLALAPANGGVLFILAVGSMGVYGIAFGGWASNNKWSLLGALRSSAQMISYEIPLTLAFVAVLMTAGTLNFAEIVQRQSDTWLGFIPAWNIFQQPLAFLIFLVAAFAETNRLPFDLPECEPELIGGYHTEYSSMKFALFFMGEYLAMVTMSSLLVTLFLGGWSCPGIDPRSLTLLSGLASVAAFSAKVGAILFVYIWVRWTLPRFRYDQLMNLGWKVLVPLALLNIVATGFLGMP
ncbi:MAG: NADH-quinone oxidoreductase subunit NuoH [Planctomycetes bacterium]|nr:NADH-quinone oxidoreductase subunit NuoH [Planctomycetota bacterium]